MRLKPLLTLSAFISMLFITVSFTKPIKSPLPAKTPLAKYISDYKYTPFTVFRSDWGVGTVITFKKKAEEIVAFKKECLEIDEEMTDATLSNLTYTLTKQNDIELNLSKAISEKLNLKGAFSDKRIKNVTIHIEKAKEVAVSQVGVNKKIRDLLDKNNQVCVDAIFGKKNSVIVRALRIESLSYTFLDKDNREIKFDAALLDKVNANADLKKEYEGKTELRIDKPTYVGYRLTQFTSQPGIQETKIIAKDLSPEQIAKLKAASGN